MWGERPRGEDESNQSQAERKEEDKKGELV